MSAPLEELPLLEPVPDSGLPKSHSRPPDPGTELVALKVMVSPQYGPAVPLEFGLGVPKEAVFMLALIAPPPSISYTSPMPQALYIAYNFPPHLMMWTSLSDGVEQ